MGSQLLYMKLTVAKNIYLDTVSGLIWLKRDFTEGFFFSIIDIMCYLSNQSIFKLRATPTLLGQSVCLYKKNVKNCKNIPGALYG